jgi:hypothetical protein
MLRKLALTLAAALAVLGLAPQVAQAAESHTATVYLSGSSFRVTHDNVSFTSMSANNSGCPVGKALVVSVDSAGDGFYEFSRQLGTYSSRGSHPVSMTGVGRARPGVTNLLIQCGTQAYAPFETTVLPWGI